MAATQTPITFPPGRMVGGSLYKGKDKDFEGRPLVYKSGPNVGKPRVDFSFGVAIPKKVAAGAHWAHEDWGKVIWQVGHTRVANAGTLGDGFAWKITDGDSAVLPKAQPNKPPPKAPKEREGYPGCWVVWFSGSVAPSIYNGTSGQLVAMPQENAVNPGDYIQVAGSVVDNESQGNPGVYINHSMVSFCGYGVRIMGSQDPSQAGFQTGVMAGASATPLGAPPAGTQAPVASAPPPAAGNPPPPPGAGATPPPAARVMLAAAGGTTYEAFRAAGWSDEQLVQAGKMAAPTAAPAATAPPPAAGTPPPPPAQTAVVPNQAYAPPPAASAPPPPPAARVMLAAAGGVSYEAFIAQGWTDALLVQHGKMAA